MTFRSARWITLNEPGRKKTLFFNNIFFFLVRNSYESFRIFFFFYIRTHSRSVVRLSFRAVTVVVAVLVDVFHLNSHRRGFHVLSFGLPPNCKRRVYFSKHKCRIPLLTSPPGHKSRGIFTRLGRAWNARIIAKVTKY